MATTDNIAYSGSNSITCTLTSRTSSATVGQGCLAISNSSLKYEDAILTITVKTGSGTLANDLACYVYLYGGGADGTFSGSSAEAVGTNASVTIDNPTNLLGPFVISCPASSTTYRLVVASVAAAFGGVLPYNWGFVLRNYTGQTLDASTGGAVYTGITYTNT